MNVENKTFSIQKVGANAVILNNFWACTMNATVSSTSLVLTAPVDCTIGNFICTRNVDVLTYTFNFWAGVDYTIVGKATRQP